MDHCSLKSIFYSDIDSTITEFTESECTCDAGDAHRTMENYKTPMLEPLLPYPKHVGERFEAEYQMCMRWAADRKFRAEKVIPFSSEFYAVARLSFIGKNWLLDCGNYDGQYDYCGWLPTSFDSTRPKKPPRDEITDSSVDESREYAGRESIHTSDTGFGLDSLRTDVSGSPPTLDPIDPNMYKLMGELSEALSTEPVAPNPPTTRAAASLNDLFFDLVELEQELSKQVKALTLDQPSIVDPFTIPTAVSFSTISPTQSEVSSTSDDELDELDEKPKSLMAQLFCLTGKKLGGGLLKNLINRS
ncbi:unnamed protein product [Caenorhabditis bovis]|uniref:Uncharacterized protein n=1 Tax=Caenorhabditis bovis TaxID=2654633 RepID=A0A8S1F013_9PELO|nr:unnamed protein product [Caenorhabditis bovis]